MIRGFSLDVVKPITLQNPYSYKKQTYDCGKNRYSEIIIRLPGDINIDELLEMKDWFEYLEVTRKSKAKQKDVDTLVKEVKKGRWNKRKGHLIK